ncbi:MAG: hypothetical protein ACKD6O_08295 [Candidatus Bathyarchaeota archaeon]
MTYVRASFACKKEVVEAFRKAVVQKYGKLHGVLNREFAKALQMRLEQLKNEEGAKNE